MHSVDLAIGPRDKDCAMIDWLDPAQAVVRNAAARLRTDGRRSTQSPVQSPR